MWKFIKNVFFNRWDTTVFWVALLSTFFIEDALLALLIWAFVVIPFFVMSEIKDYIDIKLDK